MRTMLWLLWTLILGGFSLFAQENPEEILRKAILHDATLDYSYEYFFNGGDPHRIVTVKQKHDADGAVWYVQEGKVKEKFRRQAWLPDRKQLYTPEGHIDLWMSQFEVSGIVMQEEIPRHKVGKDSTFKLEAIAYEGKDCWKITEYRARGDVYEAIVDKETEFILAAKDYDSSGRLEFTHCRRNICFDPKFSEDDFRLPPNTTLYYAKNQDEQGDLMTERVFRHSDFSSPGGKGWRTLRRPFGRDGGASGSDGPDMIPSGSPWKSSPGSSCLSLFASSPWDSG
ncbi:MAG: hypothetical protein ACI4SG_01220 [Oligosphaeraceae bacterium]